MTVAAAPIVNNPEDEQVVDSGFGRVLQYVSGGRIEFKNSEQVEGYIEMMKGSGSRR